MKNNNIKVLGLKDSKTIGALVTLKKENIPGIIFLVHTCLNEGDTYVVMQLDTGDPVRVKRQDFILRQNTNPEEILTVLEINSEIPEAMKNRMIDLVNTRIEYLKSYNE